MRKWRIVARNGTETRNFACFEPVLGILDGGSDVSFSRDRLKAAARATSGGGIAQRWLSAKQRKTESVSGGPLHNSGEQWRKPCKTGCEQGDGMARLIL